MAGPSKHGNFRITKKHVIACKKMEKEEYGDCRMQKYKKSPDTDDTLDCFIHREHGATTSTCRFKARHTSTSYSIDISTNKPS